MKRRRGCFLYNGPATRAEPGAATMTDQPKPTFAKRVPAARPRTKRYDIHGDAIPGLSLRVFPSGARSFALERAVRGRRRYARIGSADEVAVSEPAARPASCSPASSSPRSGIAAPGRRGAP